jgi:hypothetical protein
VSARCRRGVPTRFFPCIGLILLGVLVLSTVVRPSAAPSDSPISFLPPVNYVKPSAGDLTAADFDKDARLDIAVVGGGSASILYGKGDGTFAPATDYPVGDNLAQVIAADVDGDGLLDMVIADDNTNSVDVLINLGSRAFAPPVRYPVGTKPYGVTASDFNGDGRRDLAVSNNDSHNMCVLLNKGDGTFAPAVFYGGGRYPGRILSADLNRDGKTDLAMSNYVSAEVSLYFGDGSGRFSGGGSYRTGGEYPAQVVTDDFNGDGLLDLATANTFGNTISLFFGDGTGRFQDPIIHPGNQYPHMMASADLDGDGDPDLATPNNGTNYFSVLENVGLGNFLLPIRFTSGGTDTRTLTIGDFDADGLPDVAVGNGGSGTVSVFINSSLGATPAVRFVTLDSAHASPCQAVRGVVTLTAAAPPGGALVTLSSTNPAAGVPANVKVPAGETRVGFTLTLRPVTSVQTGVIAAAYNGTFQRALLMVRPASVSLLTITPNPVVGGKTATARVSIGCPADAKGFVVTLASSHPEAAAVPATVTVPAGVSTAIFAVLTRAATSPVTSLITATADGVGQSAMLQVLPAATPGNLLLNGSFEEPDISANGPGWLTYGPAGFFQYPTVADFIPGWQITRGNIDVKYRYWLAKDGQQSIDLVGDMPASIEQSFPTVPGRDYVFSGWIGHNPDNTYAAQGFGNVFLNRVFLVQLLHRDRNATRSNMRWTSFSSRFRAAASTTSLEITDCSGTPFPGGLVLDGLSVAPVGASGVAGVRP